MIDQLKINFPVSILGDNAKLIGGEALKRLGSSRHTRDIDFLVNFPGDDRAFIKLEGADLINANGNDFFAQVWDMEKGNMSGMASPKSLLELKCYAFVQHCLNGHWQKADDAEYDIKFLVRKFDLERPGLVKYYVTGGQFLEIEKVFNSVKKDF